MGDDEIKGHMAKHYFNVQMDNQIAATDIQSELERRYEEIARYEKENSKDPRVEILLDPVLDPPIQLLPVNKPDLEPLIPTWRNEL